MPDAMPDVPLLMTAQPVVCLPCAIRLVNYGDFDGNDPSVIVEVTFSEQPCIPHIRMTIFELWPEGASEPIICKTADLDHFHGLTFRLKLVPHAYDDEWTHPAWLTLYNDAKPYAESGRSWMADIKHVRCIGPVGVRVILSNDSFISRETLEPDDEPQDSGATQDDSDDASEGSDEISTMSDDAPADSDESSAAQDDTSGFRGGTIAEALSAAADAAQVGGARHEVSMPDAPTVTA